MLASNLFPQKAKNYLKHLPGAVAANIRFGFPSKRLFLIGVTGTDGKTSTSYLIHHLLGKNGYRTGLVTSVLAKIGDEEISTGFHVTTPSPYKLQRFLAKMVNKKIEYAVLETTSHAWDQFRLWGCRFKIGVLTNITPEHLDYHKNFQNYLKAKMNLLAASDKLVANSDDQSWEYVKKNFKKPTLSYGIGKQADIQAVSICQKSRGISFILVIKKGKHQGRYPVQTNLLGKFNVSNVLAAVSALLTLGQEPAKMLKSLPNFPGVIGRMEKISNRKKIKVYIDFAHTPNGLKNALSTFKSIMPKNKRLIVVLGAAGLRDQSKRPLLGEFCAKIADYAVFTSEDPRSEDLELIIRQIAKGAAKIGWRRLSKKKTKRGRLVQRKGYLIEKNRQEAINLAIRYLANKGDYVVCCGKGHERSMSFRKTEYLWSEHEAVEVALKGRRKR